MFVVWGCLCAVCRQQLCLRLSAVWDKKIGKIPPNALPAPAGKRQAAAGIDLPAVIEASATAMAAAAAAAAVQKPARESSSNKGSSSRNNSSRKAAASKVAAAAIARKVAAAATAAAAATTAAAAASGGGDGHGLPQQRLLAERKWRLGWHLKGHPSTLMTELYRVLQVCNVNGHFAQVAAVILLCYVLS